MSLVRTLKFITNHPLNRRHRTRSLMRFARWQAASRLTEGAVIHNWIEGAKVVVRNGEAGMTGNIYTGLHEFPDMAFLLHLLTDEDLFADVGANVGSYTVLASAVRRAKSVAIEPVPDTYRRLVENIRVNHMEDRVEAVQSGVGSERGVLWFTLGEDAANHVTEENAINSTSVNVNPLDDILAGRVPTLMKIDVEGFETEVIQGGKKTLADSRLKAVIMELIGSGERYGFDESELVLEMVKNEFDPFSYDPFSRTLSPLNGKNSSTGNTIFIRDVDFVRRRLALTPLVNVFSEVF